MLDNARKHIDELRNKFIDIWYDDKYKYYFCCNWRTEDEIPSNDWEKMCYVSLDGEGNIVGYISYSVDRITDSVNNFGAINFGSLLSKKIVFGRDLYRVIDDIFCKFNLSRIEFGVVIGNPIEKSYDRLVKGYGGRIIGVRKKSVRLIDNKLYDEKIYEILREDYLRSNNKI